MYSVTGDALIVFVYEYFVESRFLHYRALAYKTGSSISKVSWDSPICQTVNVCGFCVKCFVVSCHGNQA